MTKDEARTHLRYSQWASRRLLDAALALDPEKLHREMSVSHKSLYDTLAHIQMADRVWLERVLGSPVPPEEPIESAWPKIYERWQAWSDSLADSDLERIIAYKDLRGNPHQSALWQIVLHVVNHATLHRGQVMAMFRQLGVAPPPTDLIFYYRETK
jgi:uncharacterized damage-inducible protein DinB